MCPGVGGGVPRKSVLRVLLKPVVGASGSPLARGCRAASRDVGLLARALRQDPKVFEGSGQRVAREQRGGHVTHHDDTPPLREAGTWTRLPPPSDPPHPPTPTQGPRLGTLPGAPGPSPPGELRGQRR